MICAVVSPASKHASEHDCAPARARLTQPLRRALGELFFPLAKIRLRRRFPILTYHSVAAEPGVDVETVTPGDFERQMAWLAARGIRAVTVSDLVQAQARSAPGPPLVAITFDDGYRDNVTTAFPVLGRHGFAATFYVSTDYIGRLSTWNDVEYIGHRPMMTDGEIRRLADAGQEIGSHSHTHADLTRVDSARLDEELRLSRTILADITHQPIVALAPPYGRSNATVVAQAARVGYAHAVGGGRFTANRAGESPFHLRRITVARGDSLREFAKKVTGAYQWLRLHDR